MKALNIIAALLNGQNEINQMGIVRKDLSLTDVFGDINVVGGGDRMPSTSYLFIKGKPLDDFGYICANMVLMDALGQIIYLYRIDE